MGVLWFTILCVGLSSAAAQQDEPAPPYDAKRCALKIVKQPFLQQQSTIRMRKGEHATRFTLQVAFEILESGEVTNARVKRSTGIADKDALALNWIRSATYNYRPGCGVIESQSGATVDLR